MKKIVLFASVIVSMVACRKDGGEVYKFSYKTPNDNWYTATNYFTIDRKDSAYALEWYKKTEAWADISTRCDTFWIEYWGTYEEWVEEGKRGMKN